MYNGNLVVGRIIAVLTVLTRRSQKHYIEIYCVEVDVYFEEFGADTQQSEIMIVHRDGKISHSEHSL